MQATAEDRTYAQGHDVFSMTHHVECVALLTKPALTYADAIWHLGLESR